jgi:hypothetical protein
MRTPTPEDRAKAQAAKKAAIASNPYRRDWLDAPLWDSLALKRGVRLPMWHTPPTPKTLKKWHGKLDQEPFETVYGCNPARLIELNPKMPLAGVYRADAGARRMTGLRVAFGRCA